MSGPKKKGEMTFKEFFDLQKDEARKQFFGGTLKKEGFTEKQINEMKMEKAWKLFLDGIAARFERDLTSLSLDLEKIPKGASTLLPYLKRFIELLEESVKELEEEEKRRKDNSSQRARK